MDACRAFTTDIGADTMSPGLVQDGTKCGSDLICLSQDCVPVSQITSISCNSASNGLTCSGNGVYSLYLIHRKLYYSRSNYVYSRFAITMEAVHVM